MIPPYPLHWPEGLPRTVVKASSQLRTTLSAAVRNVKTSLEMFGRDSGSKVSNISATSNVGGLAFEAPKDTGVAVWFEWDGEMRCIAVDRYAKIEDNLQAIHHIIEARRTEVRHGGLHIARQTFKGFTALPAPSGESWWQVLGVDQDSSLDVIEAHYRTKAKAAHPDSGGSTAAMARLNAAREAGRRARS
jgi:hypothetical protein